MRDKMFIDKPSFPTWDKWRNTPQGMATLAIRRHMRDVRLAAQIAIDQAKAQSKTT